MAIVEMIDLKDLTKKANKLVSAPSTPSPDSDWGHSGDPLAPGDWIIWHIYSIAVDLQVNYAFIENENNWNVYVEFLIRKMTQTTHGDWVDRYANINDATINCYLSNHGTNLKIGSKGSLSATYIDDYGYMPTLESKCVSTPNPEYKLALQDGYYFTEKRSDDNVQITIYSPNGKQIFSDYFAFGSVIFGFSKVKRGFLLNIYDYESKKNKLYFLSQNKMLLTENICYNAKIRPIRRNKRNWQNQIEIINFES